MTILLLQPRPENDAAPQAAEVEKPSVGTVAAVSTREKAPPLYFIRAYPLRTAIF